MDFDYWQSVATSAYDITPLVRCYHGDGASSSAWGDGCVTLCLFTWKVLPGSDLIFPRDKLNSWCVLLSLPCNYWRKCHAACFQCAFQIMCLFLPSRGSQLVIKLEMEISMSFFFIEDALMISSAHSSKNIYKVSAHIFLSCSWLMISMLFIIKFSSCFCSLKWNTRF